MTFSLFDQLQRECVHADASVPSALITSTGIGSGLDISAIVTSLTSNYGAAQTNQLTNQQNSLDAQVSAYGTFTSALDTLQASLTSLEDPGQLAGFDATVGRQDHSFGDHDLRCGCRPIYSRGAKPGHRGIADLAAHRERQFDGRHGNSADFGRRGEYLDHHRLDQQHAVGHRGRNQFSSEQSRGDAASSRPRTVPGWCLPAPPPASPMRSP